MDIRKAITHINDNNVLLVYPIKNKTEPNSLWQELHPRKKMRWEWDAGGDQSVSDLWFMREKLSTSQKVVYTKWYQGRATFFSYQTYVTILRLFKEKDFFKRSLSPAAREILDILEENSPLSTKQLKRAAELTGKDSESRYQRALKELFNRFLIVGFGEVDEGAFPSLAIGSSQVIFEDLWQKADTLSIDSAHKKFDYSLPKDSAFRKQFDKNWKAMLVLEERFNED